MDGEGIAKPEASIICTDGSQENADRAAGYLARGGIADRIDYRVGNALEIIDETEGEFDIIYNDIDKDGYPEAFHKAIHGSEVVACLSRTTCFGWDASLHRNPVVPQTDWMNENSGSMQRQSVLEN